MPACAQVQFAPWEKPRSFLLGSLSLSVGDCVIVATELGPEMGRVLSFSSVLEPDASRCGQIIRLANLEERVRQEAATAAQAALAAGRELVNELGLKMKLVDCFVSLSGNRYNLAFIADGRIDFRDLARLLAQRLGGNIRLTQIGIRDEARLCGTCGACSRELCCQKVLKNLCPITADMAASQHLAQRSNDRLVGICGRLKCCLSYEYHDDK